RGQQYPIGDSHHQRTDDRSQKDVHASQRKPDQQRQTSEQAKVSQHTTQSFLCLCYRAVNITPAAVGNKAVNAQVTVLNMQKSNLVMTGVTLRLPELLPQVRLVTIRHKERPRRSSVILVRTFSAFDASYRRITMKPALTQSALSIADLLAVGCASYKGYGGTRA